MFNPYLVEAERLGSCPAPLMAYLRDLGPRECGALDAMLAYDAADETAGARQDLALAAWNDDASIAFARWLTVDAEVSR